MDSIARNCLRGALVLLNLVVAVRAPYFGGVLGTVGGVTDALQSFVLPPLIYMAIMKLELSDVEVIGYRAITGWGAITIVYTTAHVVLFFLK